MRSEGSHRLDENWQGDVPRDVVTCVDGGSTAKCLAADKLTVVLSGAHARGGSLPPLPLLP